jgi:tripartite-type tricarboxylate transporter receptor subunit TctC
MSRYPVLVAAAASLFATSFALAQPDPAADYPNRAVKIIVSVPAGGGVDTVTRIFAARLQQKLGQPFVIENRGGGGGNIGAEAAHTAEPDGYTLLATQPAPITSNVALYKKLNFDPVALEPVAVMSKFPNTLLVRQEFPAKTAQEFVAYVKANPGKVNYASQGVGTTSHLTAELFNTLAGAKIVHVPYRGTGPALNDLMAGQIDIMIDQTSNSINQIRAGKIRAYAVTDQKRVPTAADIPTVDEAGLPGFYMTLWSGMWVPKGAPKNVIAKLNAAVVDALADPVTSERFAQLGLEMPPRALQTPDALAAHHKAEIAKWWPIIKAGNIRAD